MSVRLVIEDCATHVLLSFGGFKCIEELYLHGYESKPVYSGYPPDRKSSSHKTRAAAGWNIGMAINHGGDYPFNTYQYKLAFDPYVCTSVDKKAVDK